jgi:hypothetical protein
MTSLRRARRTTSSPAAATSVTPSRPSGRAVGGYRCCGRSTRPSGASGGPPGSGAGSRGSVRHAPFEARLSPMHPSTLRRCAPSLYTMAVECSQHHSILALLSRHGSPHSSTLASIHTCNPQHQPCYPSLCPLPPRPPTTLTVTH